MQPESLSPLRSPDWQSAPLRLELADDEIHLWRIFLDRPPPAAELEWLDSLERARRDRLSRDTARRRFEAVHIAKRRLLAGYLGQDPAELRFTTGPKGKPSLPHSIEPSTRLSPRLEFNLSHSAELALLAVSRHLALGVDLEKLKPVDRARRIAERVFPQTQLAQLQTLSPEQLPPEQLLPEQLLEGFFRAWTEFEARQKLSGEGLFGPRIDAGAMASDGFIPAIGYVAAVAWPRHPAVLRFFSLGDLPSQSQGRSGARTRT